MTVLNMTMTMPMSIATFISMRVSLVTLPSLFPQPLLTLFPHLAHLTSNIVIHFPTHWHQVDDEDLAAPSE
jgi:hypothetical protein